MSKRGGGAPAEPPKRSRRDEGGEAARQHRGNAYTTDARLTGGGAIAGPSNSIFTAAAHLQSAADGLGPGTSPAFTALDSTTPPLDPALQDAYEAARAAEVETVGDHLQLGVANSVHYELHAVNQNAAERALPEGAMPRSGNADDARALHLNRYYLDSAGPENAARAPRDRHGADDVSPLRLRRPHNHGNALAFAEQRRFLWNSANHRVQRLRRGLNPFRHFS